MRIYDFKATETIYYLISEYIEGKTLDVFIKDYYEENKKLVIQHIFIIASGRKSPRNI
jgi:hypothetical protein